MKLRTITESDIPMIMKWRQEYPESLRTCFELTGPMMYDWFVNVVNNRVSTSRYWMILDEEELSSDGTEYVGKPIGYGNISNIQWENRFAEIGLLIGKGYLGEKKGIGGVKLLLEQAFMYMGLENIWGECYRCNFLGLDFWQKVSYITFKTDLPMRKFYDGKFWGSFYFNIQKQTWLDSLNGQS